jgi:hypothetical protein
VPIQTLAEGRQRRHVQRLALRPLREIRDVAAARWVLHTDWMFALAFATSTGNATRAEPASVNGR